MPPKLRVLIVDDAVVMRRLLTEALKRDPRIEVVGTAPNGRIALQKIPQVNPDLVTLDMEMPDLDGLSTLRELRRTHPKLPVIMFSALTQRGAVSTLDALAAGADDYVTKPVESSDLAACIAQLEAELLPKIHAHCRALTTRVQPAPPTANARTTPPFAGHPRSFDLLCIGTSTGGPNALAELFQKLTAPLPVPVAIVQHMPPMFTKLLADRLNNIPGHLRCHEAADAEPMLPGHAYLAPGGRHLAIKRQLDGTFVTQLTDTPPENSCRPAVDVLFRTAAETNAHILAVVMTGMGSDGLHGARLIAARGGRILVQDEASSVVWGMPGAIAQAGLANTVKPIPELAFEIVRRLGSPHLAPA
ncbi:protein-glutamate methylesterase/protein-glutamine glutaminase [Nibricoccus aquaticus]|nr:chemotaxis response regulator protein-glutamate methylesterase [Nibricoccus aquaticus]